MISEDLDNVLAALPELSSWTVSKFEDGSYLVRITGVPISHSTRYEIEVSSTGAKLEKIMSDVVVAALLEVIKYRKNKGVPIGPKPMDEVKDTKGRVHKRMA